MKMLVSDYDGTLLPEPKDFNNLRLNINKINEFRENGNIFILSTGRPYYSIKKEINKHNIELDYLCCQDGAAIFNKNYELLNTSYLSEKQIKDSLSIIERDPKIAQIKLYNPYEITEQLENIIEISVRKNKILELKSLKQQLEESVEGIVAFQLFNYLYIKPKCSKGSAIDYILKNIETDIEEEEVYTVGDNANDLDMLQNYNGYKMLTSYPNLYLKGLKTCRNVHTLIKKINK